MSRRRAKSSEGHVYKPSFIIDTVHFPLVRTKSVPQRWAVVDLEDFARVSKYDWGVKRNGDLLYARVTNKATLGRHLHMLHAFVMRAKPGEMFDHINGDGLDNRKANLRLCSYAENAQNSRAPVIPGKTSRFKGVHWGGNRWHAGITAFGEHRHLGSFEDETEAARAYDLAAKEMHREFARTNEMMGLLAS